MTEGQETTTEVNRKRCPTPFPQMWGEGEGPGMDPGLGHLEEKDSVGPSLTRAWALEPEPLLCRWPQVLEGNLTLLTRQ